FKVVIAALLFFLALTFSYQNDFPVVIRYWGITEGTEIPFFVAIIIAFFSGIIIGGLGGLISNFSLKRQIRKLKKQLERL
ncbi:MAG: hypothetical protein DRG31_01390, partial [Deltaproteobacteria bacterium]